MAIIQLSKTRPKSRANPSDTQVYSLSVKEAVGVPRDLEWKYPARKDLGKRHQIIDLVHIVYHPHQIIKISRHIPVACVKCQNLSIHQKYSYRIHYENYPKADNIDNLGWWPEEDQSVFFYEGGSAKSLFSSSVRVFSCSNGSWEAPQNCCDCPNRVSPSLRRSGPMEQLQELLQFLSPSQSPDPSLELRSWPSCAFCSQHLGNRQRHLGERVQMMESPWLSDSKVLGVFFLPVMISSPHAVRSRLHLERHIMDESKSSSTRDARGVGLKQVGGGRGTWEESNTEWFLKHFGMQPKP